ncbi:MULTISPECIES: putative nucleotidyltransferase substrate binding domain-containing protein [Ramlibacter]|uniref:Cyclic nucleotide-binding domain-containing protein n=1 Tax=Ramlibacter aquaticus TaxID=2780094 RepID=A0ABR9SAB9_9BURK|nr:MULTISPECIES: putative nucleotidyltransferase substrate binding domain-containing protein [Ramlibacter]MBE7939164.1 cyclic nucleotide-binding domain-containing protein [Ramlibacter aquaticus]
MPNAFNFAASPFDCLQPQERRLVRDSVDIAYFRAGELILDVGARPTHLFVVIKGRVTQHDGEELVATYGPDDTFDGRGLVAGRVSHRFVAAEEVVAYQLAQATVSSLIASNATFGALLFSDLGHKLSAIAQRQDGREMQSLTLSRVDEAYLRPPQFVDATTDILSVVRIFQQHRSSNVLVRDRASEPPRLGIFTATALQRAILDGRPLDRLPVGELSNFQLITVRPGDQLGDAMALMLRRRVHRVVVMEGEEIRGVLEALDLFSFLSNHSHLISVRIEDATDLQGLSQAASQITKLIALLERGGTKVALIAQLVQGLNARLFERAWQLVAGPDLVAHSCLFVMGSEGRGEQLLKTDQDNALVLREGYLPPADLQATCDRFSQVLADFGYPPCPGRVMENNPAWRGDVAAFSRQAREWLLMPTPDSLMKLAIFMDAHAVGGDAKLLDAVRDSLFQLSADNDLVLARFAAAIDSFAPAAGWLGRLFSLGGEGEGRLDLKKEGLFPLVHGVRALAFAHGVRETGTAARIARLAAAGQLPAALGHELTDSLHFFMGLRLKAGLAELDRGQPVSGAIELASLGSLDRDLLKDTLEVVRRFRGLLRQRFRLDLVS